MSLIFDSPTLTDIKRPLRLNMYRLCYEDSGNKSVYHPEADRERQHPHQAPLQHPREAITAYSTPEPNHFTQPGRIIQRALLQRCKSPPYSPFISCSDDLATTIERVTRWYSKGARLITIIVIHTKGMIPALLRIYGQSDMRVLVSEHAKPKNGNSISLDAFFNLNPQPELWISMCQLKADGPFGDWWHRTSYQPDEWLICRALPKSRVLETWPCTGTTIVRRSKTELRLVTEYLRSVQYYWDYKNAVWQRLQGRKRSLSQSESSDETEGTASEPESEIEGHGEDVLDEESEEAKSEAGDDNDEEGEGEQHPQVSDESVEVSANEV